VPNSNRLKFNNRNKLKFNNNRLNRLSFSNNRINNKNPPKICKKMCKANRVNALAFNPNKTLNSFLKCRIRKVMFKPEISLSNSNFNKIKATNNRINNLVNNKILNSNKILNVKMSKTFKIRINNKLRILVNNPNQSKINHNKMHRIDLVKRHLELQVSHQFNKKTKTIRTSRIINSINNRISINSPNKTFNKILNSKELVLVLRLNRTLRKDKTFKLNNELQANLHNNVLASRNLNKTSKIPHRTSNNKINHGESIQQLSNQAANVCPPNRQIGGNLLPNINR